MRIATLVCPSFTVLAGVLLKANGDRHTLQYYPLCSRAAGSAGSHSVFSGADATDAAVRRAHGRRVMAYHTCAATASAITREKGKTRMTRVCQHPSTTAIINSHRKQWKQRLPTSAGVNCCCWLQGHGRYRNSNDSSPRPHWRVGALVPSNNTWREHRL